MYGQSEHIMAQKLQKTKDNPWIEKVSISCAQKVQKRIKRH